MPYNDVIVLGWFNMEDFGNAQMGLHDGLHMLIKIYVYVYMYIISIILLIIKLIWYSDIKWSREGNNCRFVATVTPSEDGLQTLFRCSCASLFSSSVAQNAVECCPWEVDRCLFCDLRPPPRRTLLRLWKKSFIIQPARTSPKLAKVSISQCHF